MDIQQLLKAWHSVVEDKRVDLLDTLLDDDAQMVSPVVHTPQRGKEITAMYLTAAATVFANDSFRYTREFISENSAVLEFETEIEGIHVNGVDMITYNENGKITEFKVMVRPLQALNLIHKMMGAEL